MKNAFKTSYLYIPVQSGMFLEHQRNLALKPLKKTKKNKKQEALKPLKTIMKRENKLG